VPGQSGISGVQYFISYFQNTGRILSRHYRLEDSKIEEFPRNESRYFSRQNCNKMHDLVTYLNRCP
jgi:hypothetical protein